MLSVIFYARLWRRSAVLTDLEFIEVRYSGKSAAGLRVFMAFYMGVISNCITMGWVMLAVGKLASEAFAWPETITIPTGGGGGWAVSGRLVLLAVMIAVVLFYTTLSGLWGVVTTDLIQFAIAMLGAIALAWLAVADLGGPRQMVEAVAASPGVDPRVFSYVPQLDTAGGVAVFTFAVYVTVQWWAGTRGAGYANQRLLAARNETHATYMMIWGTFAHYVVRTWPWVVVGVASLAYFPLVEGEDPELAYPRMMVQLLPAGLRGLMVVGFIAAFMSTMDTHLNWGASYVVNDVYRRFANRRAGHAHYVMVSRLTTVALACLGGVAAWQMDSIAGAWMYLAKLGAGAGLVVLLRWFWWRVNAWSEISALATSFVLANVLPFVPGLGGDDTFAVHLVIIVAAATAVWLAVTLLTAPADEERLVAFYRKVRPGGWWGPIARRCPDVMPDRVSRGWPAWAAGVACIYAAMFGVGDLCLGRYGRGAVLLAVAAATGWFLLRAVASLSSDQDPDADRDADAKVEQPALAAPDAG
jgi:SSS family solute:Na+ symporter